MSFCPIALFAFIGQKLIIFCHKKENTQNIKRLT